MNALKKVLLIVALLLSQNGFAQDYLIESSAPIRLHKRKSSPYSLLLESNGSSSYNSVTAYLFMPGEDKYKDLDEKALNFTSLPQCEDSKVQLDEVFHNTKGSDAINFILYDYMDSRQVNKANSQSRVTIPWDPNYDPTAGHKTVDAKLQDLARAMNPSCLPSSFRFIYSGSKRYLEIKTGDKAWD